jgi:dihydrodipicolinate synthase/N-acetylneuraminate lyase
VQSEEIMVSKFSRREFVGQAARAAAALPLVARTGTGEVFTPPQAHKGFHGIFAILQTPFTSSGLIDDEDLAHEANFCVRCGAHGLVWPQLAAEFYLLSDEERMHGAEILIRTVAGRRPVVIGVQAPYKDIAVKLARHAESKGADAVIAMPPFVGQVDMDDVADYYKSLVEAIRLPVFVQNSGSPWGPGLSPQFVLRQARQYPQLAYIKEEVGPVPHRLEMYARSGAMTGIFSGSAGRNLLNELPRGSSGTMPACDFIDVNAQVYELAVAGKTQQAYHLFKALLPMINLEETYGMAFAKKVLVRRGIFKLAKMRDESVNLDQADERELDHWWEQLQPYLKMV